MICLFLRRGERPPTSNSFDFVERLNIDATIITKIEISPGTPICGSGCGLKKQKPRPLPCLSSGRAETAKHRPENFLDALSNFGPAVRRVYSEGQAIGPPENRYRRMSCHSIWLLVTSPTTSTRPP